MASIRSIRVKYGCLLKEDTAHSRSAMTILRSSARPDAIGGSFSEELTSWTRWHENTMTTWQTPFGALRLSVASFVCVPFRCSWSGLARRAKSFLYMCTYYIGPGEPPTLLLHFLYSPDMLCMSGTGEAGGLVAHPLHECFCRLSHFSHLLCAASHSLCAYEGGCLIVSQTTPFAEKEGSGHTATVELSP